MTSEDAISFFRNGKRLAGLLKMNPVNVYKWGVYPPELRQRQIEDLTGGRLKVESSLKLTPVLEKWQE